MNMSDDVAGAVVSVSAKASEEVIHVANSVLEAIWKLLHYMAERDKENREQKKSDVQNKEVTDIKSGKVSTKELYEHCRKSHEDIVSSEHGLNKADVNTLAAKAKKCGIPIAFRSNKGHDNVYASVRKSDLALFKQICTETIKEKLEVRPQELKNFKCKEWEIPFINAELKQHDLSAQFAQTKAGEYFAMYEMKDAKAIEIARSEFVRKSNEVEKNIDIAKDSDGFFIIKDSVSGKTVSFNDTPNKKFVSQELQKNFGFDENKADIAAAKFGQEMLTGEDKKKYFDNDPTAEFTYVSKVSWDNEDVMTKPYDCYYITPKQDGVSRIVYQSEDGRFAILNPPRQTQAKMRTILEENLGIKDVHEQDALIAKAEHVSVVNAKYRNILGSNEDLHIHEAEFTKGAFDLSDPTVASGMLRTDENGNTFTKTQPFDSISTAIERKDANTFEVKSTVNATESDQNGQSHQVSREQTLMLSFSNKKTALEELKEMYKSQGVSDAAAKDMAKSVYHKAELQSAEPLLAIEQIKNSSILVSDGKNVAELPAADRTEAIEVLHEKYGVPIEDATAIVDKSNEGVDTNINDNSEAVINNEKSDVSFSNKNNGHELHPEGNMLANKADKLSSAADKAEDMAEKIEEHSSRGGR